MPIKNDPFIPNENLPGTGVDLTAQQSIVPSLDKLPDLFKFTGPALPPVPTDTGVRVPNIGRRASPVAPKVPDYTQADLAGDLDNFAKAIGYDPSAEEEIGRIRTLSSGFGRGFVSGVGGDLPEGLAMIGSKIGIGPTDPREGMLGKIAQWRDEKLDEFLPENARYKGDFLYGVSNGLGQVGGTLLSILIPGGLLAKGGKIVGMGLAGASGFSTSAKDVFQDAIKHNAPLSDAIDAGLSMGAFTGITEQIPLWRLLNRVDRASGGGIKQALFRAAKTGTEEAIQEASEAIFQNLLASDLFKYDAERQTLEGLSDAAGVGFTVGSIADLVVNLLSGRRNRGGAPSAGNLQPGAPPGTPQLPPPDNVINAEFEPAPGPLPGPTGYDALPPPPSRSQFISDQIDRLRKLDDMLRADDPNSLGDPNVGQSISFFSYLANSETELDRLQALPAERRAEPEVYARMTELAKNRELIDLMTDPIRLVDRSAWVLQMPAANGKPGRVVVLDTDSSGQPILKKDGKVAVGANGKDVLVGKGDIKQVNSAKRENLLLTPVGRQMLREASERAERERKLQQAAQQEDMDASAGNRESARRATQPTPAALAAPAKALPAPQGRAYGDGFTMTDPNQQAEQADPAGTDEGQRQQEAANAERAAVRLFDARSGAELDTTIPKSELPDGLREQIEQRAKELGQPVPDTLTQQELIALGADPEIARTMFALRATVENAARAQATAAAGRRNAKLFTAKGRTAILNTIFPDPKKDKKWGNAQTRAAAYRILMAMEKSLGRPLDGLAVLNLTVQLARDPQMVSRLAGRPISDNVSAFVQQTSSFVDGTNDRMKQLVLALRQGQHPAALRDLAHELTHVLVHVQNFSRGSLGQLWENLRASRDRGELGKVEQRVFDHVQRNYGDQTTDMQAEEWLSFMVEETLAGRYDTSDHLGVKLPEPLRFLYDFVKRMYNFVRDIFRPMNPNTVDEFLKNVERSFGVTFLRGDELMQEYERGFTRFAIRGDDNVAPFYPKLATSIETAVTAGRLPKRATASQYVTQLQAMQRKGEFNLEELRWTGNVLGWLERMGDAKVDSVELLDYIRNAEPVIMSRQPILRYQVQSSNSRVTAEDPLGFGSEDDGTELDVDEDYVDQLSDENFPGIQRQLYKDDPDSVFSNAVELHNRILTDIGVLDEVGNLTEFGKAQNTDHFKVNKLAERPRGWGPPEVDNTLIPALDDVQTLLESFPKRTTEDAGQGELIAGQPPVFVDELHKPTFAVEVTFDGGTDYVPASDFGNRSQAEMYIARQVQADYGPSAVGKIVEGSRVEILSMEIQSTLADINSYTQKLDEQASDTAREDVYYTARESTGYEWDGEHGYRIVQYNRDGDYTIFGNTGRQIGTQGTFEDAVQFAVQHAERYDLIADEAGPSADPDAPNAPVAIRGPKWGSYNPLKGVPVLNYDESLLVWENAARTNDTRYVNDAHWGEHNKDVIAFQRHGTVELQLGKDALDATFALPVRADILLEAQSDWAKENDKIKSEFTKQVALRLNNHLTAAKKELSDIVGMDGQPLDDGQVPYVDYDAGARLAKDMLEEFEQNPLQFMLDYGQDGVALMARDGARIKELVQMVDTLSEQATQAWAAVENGTPGAPFVGDQVSRIQPSWLELSAKEHIRRAVLDKNTPHLAWVTGEQSAKLWNVTTFKQITIEPMPNASFSNGKTFEEVVKRAREIAELIFNHEIPLYEADAAMREFVGGSGTASENLSLIPPDGLGRLSNQFGGSQARIADQAVNLMRSYGGVSSHTRPEEYLRKAMTPPAFKMTLSGVNTIRRATGDVHTAETKFFSNHADLADYVGKDIVAAMQKRGNFLAGPVSATAEELGVTYIAPPRGDGEPNDTAGYRMIYDQMYPRALIDFIEKMGWAKKGELKPEKRPIEHGVDLREPEVWYLKLPDAAVEWVENRGQLPMFGMKAAIREEAAQRSVSELVRDKVDAAVRRLSSPAFKRWFGDSKVVDSSGNPLMVFHGTDMDFESFDPDKRGERTGANSAKMGFFFAKDPAVASSYATTLNVYRDEAIPRLLNSATFGMYQRLNEGFLRIFGMSGIEDGGNVIPAYLSLQNPLVVDFNGGDYHEKSYSQLVKDAKQLGHDGLIMRNTSDPGFDYGASQLDTYIASLPTDVYVAFEPTQIKSPFNTGTFNPDDARISFALRNGQQISSAEWVRDQIEQASNWWGRIDRVFTQTSQRIRALGGTDAAYELGNEFRRDIHSRVGPGKKGLIGEDYHGVVEALGGQWFPRLYQLLDSLPPQSRPYIGDILRGRYLNPTTGRVDIPPESGLSVQQARDLRAFLAELRDFTNNHMEGNTQFGAGKGSAYVKADDLVGHIQNYFPQHWELTGKFGGEARPDLQGINRSKAALQFFKAAGLFQNSTDRDEAISEMIDKINGANGIVSYASSLGGQYGNPNAIADSTKERILKIDPQQTYRIKIDGKDIDVSLSDFLDNDPTQVLHRYVAAMLRHAEFARRFGPSGQVIDDYLKRIKAERVQAGMDRLDAPAQQQIVSQIHANLGVKPNFNSDLLSNANQWAGVTTNILRLSLSTIANLSDIAMPMVRLGFAAQGNALTAGIRSLLTFRGNSPDQQLARDLGIIRDEFQRVLQESAVEFGNWNAQKVNNTFFKAILLEQLTRWTRTMSTAAAKRALPVWRDRAMKGQKKYDRFLQEVGLTAKDLQGYDPDNYRAGQNLKIDAAIRQLVGEMTIAPHAGMMAAWQSDPRFRLVAQIKSYLTGFNNTVLQRVGREAMYGDFMPVIRLAAFAALAALTYELREYLVWGKEGNPNLRKLGLDEKSPIKKFVFNMFDRGGLFGPLQYAVDLFSQTRVGSAGTAGALVPFLGVVEQARTALAGLFRYLWPAGQQDPDDWRAFVDNMTRLTPGLNMAGPARVDLVNAIAPSEAMQQQGAGGAGLSTGGFAPPAGVNLNLRVPGVRLPGR